MGKKEIREAEIYSNFLNFCFDFSRNVHIGAGGAVEIPQAA
jgi:hypothetical protein